MEKLKKFKSWHFKAIKDYSNGVNLRIIADKYKCHDGTVVMIAKQIGITPRPSGFASYTVAHKWVTQARLDYERLVNGARSPLSNQD